MNKKIEKEYFKIFQTEEDFQNFLNETLSEEKNKFNNLNTSYKKLENDLIKFQKLENHYKNLEIEKDNWKNKTKSIIDAEWNKLPVNNKKVEWDNLINNLDLNNLKTSLIKYADDNQLLVQQENPKNINTQKTNIFIDEKKGIIF